MLRSFLKSFALNSAQPDQIKIGNTKNHHTSHSNNLKNIHLPQKALFDTSALWLPMLELLAALAVMTGVLRRGGDLIISGLLVIFIVAVSFNVLRGHEFNCGCTSTDTYLAGWNDKYMLILRDIGLMVMSAMAVFHRPGKTTD
nr:MauE/DoxX family redox-associated membrane protein [Acanthopleuribacter pedis]